MMAPIATATFFVLALLLCGTSRADNSHAQNEQANSHQNSNHRHERLHVQMNDLLGSVRDAVKGAEGASDQQRQVVNLESTLRLIETKFSGLRAALAEELSSSQEKMDSHSSVTSKLANTTTAIVRSIVTQRDTLKQLSKDMIEIGLAVRKLREGLQLFDGEMYVLQTIVKEVNDAHKKIASSHHQIRRRINVVASDSLQGMNRQRIFTRFLFLISILEIALLVLYVFYKRSSLYPGTHRAYGKYG